MWYSVQQICVKDGNSKFCRKANPAFTLKAVYAICITLHWAEYLPSQSSTITQPQRRPPHNMQRFTQRAWCYPVIPIMQSCTLGKRLVNTIISEVNISCHLRLHRPNLPFQFGISFCWVEIWTEGMRACAGNN